MYKLYTYGFLISVLFNLNVLYSQDIFFEHITLEKGLPDNNINAIVQDSLGYIWIGTNNGLSKYNGYNIKSYQHKEGNINTLSSNEIRDLLIDSRGKLWITTNKGLHIYQREYDWIERIRYDSLVPNSIKANDLSCLLEDKNGKIWIGTSWHGIYTYDPMKNNYQYFSYTEGDTSVSSVQDVNDFERDKHGNVWIAGRNGLYKYSVEAKKFTRISDRGPFKALSSNLVFIDLMFDSDERLWILEKRNGILIYNLKNEQVSPGLTYPDFKAVGNTFKKIMEDSEHNLWIGSDKALNYYDKKNNILKVINKKINTPNSLSDNSITCLFEDIDKNIWVGTRNAGINLKVKSKYNFHYINQIPKSKNKSFDNSINTVCKDSENILWIGTKYNGLFAYDAKNEVFRRYPIKNINNRDIETIFSIYEDSSNQIWVGTAYGLFKFNRNDYNFTEFPYILAEGSVPVRNLNILCFTEDNENNLWIGSFGQQLFTIDEKRQCITKLIIGETTAFVHNKSIYCLLNDKFGEIWIGGRKGLYIYNQSDSTLRSFLKHKGDLDVINTKEILTLVEDDMNIWVGTNFGLYQINSKKNIVKGIFKEDGLLDNKIYAVIIDNDNHVWVSSELGLTEIIIDSQVIRCKKYLSKNCFPKNQFIPRSYFQDNEGICYFGGSNGIVYFNPDSITHKNDSYKVWFEDLVVNNQVVNPYLKNTILKQNISLAKKFKLNHKHSVFKIYFSAINYNPAHQIQYAYMLEGFNVGDGENDWTYSGEVNFATYTNLSPGRYTFKVKATDTEGDWNQPISEINLIIIPAPWKTWWAITIYILIFISTLFFIIRISWRLKLEHIEKEKIYEIGLLKTKFFTNISHDIKTPLTLILAPIEKMISSRKFDLDLFNIIESNGQRLLRLVNQLLDLRKIETVTMKLNRTHGDIISYIQSIVYSFKGLALEKNIELNFCSDKKELYVQFDADKIEKILFNLISNAFNYTPENNKIKIDLLSEFIKDTDSRTGILKILIADTGIGIPDKDVDRIFDRFYQVSHDKQKSIGGSGIGLSHTKDLVEILGGTIGVQSNKPNKGTTFNIILPITISEEKESDLQEENNINLQETEKNALEKEEVMDEEKKHDKPILLIVDDNPDIRKIIIKEFDDNYSVIEAYDGAEGYNVSASTIPDIIITDIMMPNLDGLEMLTKIRTDEKTCHIPVLLLSAKSAIATKLKGLEAGAEDYITKPFNLQEVHLKVNNLLSQRKKLWELFKKTNNIDELSHLLSKIDNQYIKNLKNIVLENIVYEKLDINFLASKVGISRSQLYRKVKSLTGISVNEFIRKIKIEKAADLLKNPQFNVMEVTYQIGISNRTYFNKCFKEAHGETPSQYAERYRNN